METNKVVPENVEKADHTDIDKLVHIEDSYTTNTAINPTKYPDEYNMLLAYPEGSTIIVNYFHKQESAIDTKTYVSDISYIEDDVHKDLTEIKNFELRLTEALNHQFDSDDNTFSISGEAVVYPGFTPFIGDTFFFQLNTSDVGEFRIKTSEPTTYRTGRYHRVTFEFINYVDTKRYDEILRNVHETLIFDKRAYLETGTLTFLTSESYVDLTELRRYRKELILYYMDSFYDKTMYSLIRPDGIYDPYIVKFIQTKFTTDDYRKRPTQLYSRMTDYNKSIWYHITDVYDKAYFGDLEKRCVVNAKRSFTNMTDHNALINREFITLTNDEFLCDKVTATQYYFLSESFYIGDKEIMNDIELLLYKYLTENHVDSKKVIETLHNYKRMELMDRFYYIPILIELVDYSINSVGR